MKGIWNKFKNRWNVSKKYMHLIKNKNKITISFDYYISFIFIDSNGLRKYRNLICQSVAKVTNELRNNSIKNTAV